MGLENNWIGSAIEGVSYVGKTTTVKTIKNILPEVILVPEYSEIGQLPKFPPKDKDDLRASISQIVDLEKRRTDYLNDALVKNRRSHVIFDRGPISCIAFQYVANKHGYIGSAIDMAEKIQTAHNDGQLLLPLGYILLSLPVNQIYKREEDSLNSGHRPNIEFLRNRGVILDSVEVFKRFLNFYSISLCIETKDKPPIAVATELMRFILNHSGNDIPENNLQKFALELEGLK